MKKILLPLSALCLLCSIFVLSSCNDGETYADMKNKERNAINRFLKDNELCGPIKVISESQFYAQDSLTNVDKNEFVLFSDKGIYLQIVQKGEGQTMAELAKQQPDSTVTKVILSRFLEYDIENADTTYSNYYTPAIVDKMQCTYNQRGRSYSATFTEGYMKSYRGAYVPEGWMKALDFIRLTRNDGRKAKVRMIIPSESGTSHAMDYVLPYYYEITYQLGK